jgi:hypothetical protein
MQITELKVGSKEQKILLSNGYSADIKFDVFYKRWYYDLYKDGELKYAGIALNVNTVGLFNISPVSLGLIDIVGDKEEYEPYNELGTRLMLVEVTE